MQPTSTLSSLQMLKIVKKIKQDSPNFTGAMGFDKPSLFSFSQDFGKLIQSNPSAIFTPHSLVDLKQFVQYAHQEQLPLTLRANGLSQSGQALASNESIIVNLSKLDGVLECSADSILVEANTSFRTIIKTAALYNSVPPVIPYNCDLGVGGVISAGGIGASSFKYGAVVDNILELEVMLADGSIQWVGKQSPLFAACLGGQGRCAIITKARLTLRSCKKQVKTFFLLYYNKDQWLQDLELAETLGDYIESFCTPAVVGATIDEAKQGRFPLAEWLYMTQITLEFEDLTPALDDRFKPDKIIHTQEEDRLSFMFRHDGRFQTMKALGQWKLYHPWYECFVDKTLIERELPTLLSQLPLFYATVLQVIPVSNRRNNNFLMMPQADKIVSIMILNAGLPKDLVEPCLKVIERLDNQLLVQGSKRYLSGFLGKNIEKVYWEKHFDQKYKTWLNLKKQYDPTNQFCSFLFPNAS